MPAILDPIDQSSIDGINTWYASKVVVSGVGWRRQGKAGIDQALRLGRGSWWSYMMVVAGSFYIFYGSYLCVGEM